MLLRGVEVVLRARMRALVEVLRAATWIVVWTTNWIYVDFINATDYATPFLGTLPMKLEHIAVLYVDLIHDTDYATPFLVTLSMTLKHIVVCLVVILLVGEVPSQVYLTVILIAKRHVTKSIKK
jgi:uncharacterized membrane protein (DUF485 family)